MNSATMATMSLSAATNTTVATTAKAATIGDSASTRTIYLIVAVLVVLAVAVVLFTVVFWRRTRPVAARVRPGAPVATTSRRAGNRGRAHPSGDDQADLRIL